MNTCALHTYVGAALPPYIRMYEKAQASEIYASGPFVQSAGYTK